MNVPQLRFDDFDGEWKHQELNELLEFKNGINADKDSYGYGTKFINVLDILNNDYILSENIIGSVNATAKQLQTYSVTHGDILFLRSSETREDVGKCNVYLDEEKASVFGGFVIRGKKIANYSPFFLKTALNNSSARNQISSKAGGSTRYNVGQGILSEVTVRIPEIEEQEKISSFLMLLNQKIEKQQEKIEKLEQFKKGTMQKIFSQELRFKNEDGGEFSEWESKRVADTGQVVTGNTPSKYIETYWNDPKLPWITPTDINGSKEIFTSSSKLSESGYQKSRKVPANSLLVTCIASIGKNAILKVDGSCNQQINAIIPNNDHDVDFLYYLIEYFNHRIKSIAGTTATAIVNKTTFENLLFLIPVYEEQKEIAILLSKLDEKVEKEKEKLMVLEEQKKGFMQGILV